ncbi:hypothetical protein Scep_012862 [Stephania cephalantha]|uniref:Uncharacterized protein n=1 Tax=Stephania cephalantha TaxID=152367 RepID=A0AAP0JFW1_9MAGN
MNPRSPDRARSSENSSTSNRPKTGASIADPLLTSPSHLSSNTSPKSPSILQKLRREF